MVEKKVMLEGFSRQCCISSGSLMYSACVLQNEILQKSGSPLAPRQEVLKDINLYKECPEMMEINMSLKNF